MSSISPRESFLLSRSGAVAAAIGPAESNSLASSGPAMPNFVVILIDDMGYGDIEPFGSRLNRTPNLNRMAAEGMKLTSFYAAPLCTPSRAQLMTGCYAKRVSLPDVIFPSAPIGLSTSEHTVAGLLKARGYATECVGKWHLGDQPEFLPCRHGFDHYVGIPYSNDMGGTSGAPGEKHPPLPLLRDETVVEAPVVQDRLVERYTQEGIEFIRANRDRPFFLYLPHTAVHVPLHPGEAFRGRSANGLYGDWVEEVDWSVGEILNTLRDLKLEKNTLVLFTSDNGPWLSKGSDGGTALPLRGGKGSTWEGGMRVPTIAWWPGRVAAGSVCDAVTGEIDLLPTLVGLAGGALPNGSRIDGKDIWPLLSGRAKESPHEALYFFNGSRLEAVRSGPWKLAIVAQALGMGAPPPGEDAPRLYNLDADIGETTDVAARHPEVVRRLQALVDVMDADLGSCGQGPGVRPPGRVANPQPLRRSAIEYD